MSIAIPFIWQDDGRPHCIATYDFAGEAAEDLVFKAGSHIFLLKRINSEWLYGSLDGREGMFPAAFVDVVSDIDEGKSSQCICLLSSIKFLNKLLINSFNVLALLLDVRK